MEINDIKKIGVAGAGIMGAGIAQVFAENGYSVVLYDIAEDFLKKGRNLILHNQASLIKGEILTEAAASEALARIEFSIDKNSLADVDLLVEAIIEKLPIKQQFWAEMEGILKPSAIMATNTSGLNINEIAQNLKRKSDFAVMHWWNPPHIIPLVEIAKGEETSEDTVNLLVEITKKVRHKPVVIRKNAHGFICNRIQFAVLRETLHMVEEGIATPEDIDTAMKYGLGFRYAVLGPFESADLGGIDTFHYVSSYLFADLDNSIGPSKVLAGLVNKNQLGLKTGKGFYDYSQVDDGEILGRRDDSFIKINKALGRI